MKSCLYECEVMHARFSPRRHRFAYRIFLFALDLDELPDLPRRIGFFGFNRRHLYALHEGDFLPLDEPRHPAGPGVSPSKPAAPGGLKARVATYLQHHGIDLAERTGPRCWSPCPASPATCSTRSPSIFAATGPGGRWAPSRR